MSLLIGNLWLMVTFVGHDFKGYWGGFGAKFQMAMGTTEM